MKSGNDKRQVLAMQFTQGRAWTMQLSSHLTIEDHVVQSAWFASPAKWHLAHTTWFYETFILTPHWPEHGTWNPAWDVLFNSYYNAVGEQFPQARRGLLARPTVREVKQYRHAVDQAMLACIYQCEEALFETVERLVVLGLHHEKQHQELFLTDIKHMFATNPLRPVFAPRPEEGEAKHVETPSAWHTIEEGVYDVGIEDEAASFFFDNEGPAHKVYLHGAQLAPALVTNGQYIEFIEDGGYETTSLWLADGWHEAKSSSWSAPMYWTQQGGQWFEMTLHGFVPVDVNAPVTHISYYEADAFATWAEARLPTEFEWEVAVRQRFGARVTGQFSDSGVFHPVDATDWYGSVWQWTASPYVGYPGYEPLAGALGEYNGKFMCNTIVLRGGSCASGQDHLRATYRNFFAPQTRWQFSGLRLAKDLL